ncbi:flagellin and related hook-associated protein [Burkholderiales bacterium GJ-E10]|nr:flagellin and related hook-associated protein [Burkholderiales bacterium GJ-E10]
MLSLQTNSLSLFSQNAMTVNQQNVANDVQQLSSGYRINTAANDPAGLQDATLMQAQVNGLNQGVMNANDAASMAQTASGALTSVVNMLQQMRTLAVEANNTTTSTSDAANLSAEFTALSAEIGSIISQTQYNGITMFGTGGVTVATFQVGANSGNTISIDVSGSTLNSSDALSTALASTISAGASGCVISNIDAALNEVLGVEAKWGAGQIKAQQAAAVGQVDSLNLASARSQIIDTNYAQASSALSQAQVIQQASATMLTQANTLPQTVLTLLKNF